MGKLGHELGAPLSAAFCTPDFAPMLLKPLSIIIRIPARLQQPLMRKGPFFSLFLFFLFSVGKSL